MEARIVKKDGVAVMDKELDFMLGLLPNGEYTLTIKKAVKKRSQNQNNLMWMWFRCLGNFLRSETGDERWATKDGIQTLHDIYSRKFLTTQVVGPDGAVMERVRGTSTLTTQEMSHFLEAVKIDLNTELGMIVPLPSDKYYSEFAALYSSKY